MKIGKTALKLTTILTVRGDAKRRKTYPPHGEYEERLDIPYCDDGDELHKFDLYYADKTKPNYKGVTVVDIHGGAYMFGTRKNNFALALSFLKEGFNFVALDYIPVKNDRGVDSLLSDCALCIAFISNHKEELGLGGERFVLTGDSAGGHLALCLQYACDDPSYERKLGVDLGGFSSFAVLVNCTVFDMEAIVGMDGLTEGAKKMMLGPRYNERDYAELYSPKTNFYRLSAPIFASTCTKDFIRVHSLSLMEAIGNRPELISKALDIKDESVGHVHNVIEPNLPASKEVNEAMVEFIVGVMGK